MGLMAETEARQTEARQARIADWLEQRGTVRTSELVASLGVTDTSIRRDLAALEAQGRLIRVHGGAIAPPRDPRAARFAAQARLRMAHKRRIGLAAAALIRPGEVLLFDAGTTAFQVAAHIPEALRAGGLLTVVTNSYPLINELRTWPSPNCIFLGGLYLPDYQASVGPIAVSQLQALTADRAFLGADGLTLDGGMTTAHVLMAELDRAMAERARSVVLVADSTKLGRAGFYPVLPIERLNTIVTDDGADAQLVAGLRARGLEVILA
jgi:DeoR/GlpR family transcriptional regulator of sugar metabolism